MKPFLLGAVLLITACQSTQLSQPLKPKTLYPASNYLKQSQYQPALEANGINMIPNGIDLISAKRLDQLSAFEFTTDKFEADLIKVTVSSQQLNGRAGRPAFSTQWKFGRGNRFAFIERWEITGLFEGHTNYEVRNEGYSSYSSDETDIVKRDFTVIVKNVDQIRFNLSTLNLLEGDIQNYDLAHYINSVKVETAHLSNKTITKAKWSYTSENNRCSYKLPSREGSFKFSYNSITDTFYKTFSTDPLIQIEYSLDELKSLSKYPNIKHFAKEFSLDVELEDCSFNMQIKRDTQWNLRNEDWKTVYEISPDHTMTFEELGINVSELK